MSLVRLIGLTLLVTSIFLTLIAAITKTTHLQLLGSGASVLHDGSPVVTSPGLDEPPLPTAGSQFPNSPTEISIPIIWPLLAAAALGLLMWFAVPADGGRRSAQTPSTRRRRNR